MASGDADSALRATELSARPSEPKHTTPSARPPAISASPVARGTAPKASQPMTAVQAVIASPAVNSGTLYVSTGRALQALDAKTGSAVWSYTPPNTGALVSTPAVADGLVFVGSTDDNLYAIRA